MAPIQTTVSPEVYILFQFWKTFLPGGGVNQVSVVSNLDPEVH